MTRGYIPTESDEQLAVVIQEIKKLEEIMGKEYWRKASKSNVLWEAVRLAWVVEGRNPIYHREMKKLLKEKWPKLYYALLMAIEGRGK